MFRSSEDVDNRKPRVSYRLPHALKSLLLNRLTIVYRFAFYSTL